ncbi:MAG: hypothetical protein WBB88_14755, partial [Methyloceanibacter sp.]
MEMFGGLTKTSSRIAIAAALGLTFGGFAMSASPAKAADLGGDCCADLEERVAELEATTVRKGNKKVSVTLSGWVVKLGSWWDDGHETNFYTGDKDTTLSSHFQISGSAQIAPGWSAGYTIAVEAAGTSASVGFCENQFNDNCALFGDINTLLSYMWVKSDKWGTINWGQLSQATDNVALLPDLSGTVIESNGVVFDGAGMFVRPKGTKNSNDLAGDFAWAGVLTCNTAGGGLGADCNGYPQNAFRYDTPTFGGFSASTSYGEDDMWDVAVKYAADWNSVKFSAAAGYTMLTDEGCSAPGTPKNGVGNCSNVAVVGGGGAPYQNYRQEGSLFQVGASIMHVPSGLFFYGMYQNDQNDGTQYQTVKFNLNKGTESLVNSNANESDTWFVKAGIKRTFTPAGATVIWGEWGQYNDMFRGLCGGQPGGTDGGTDASSVTICNAQLPIGVYADGSAMTADALVTGSEVTRYGIGVVQEIDSAAMHLFARWQHLDLDLDATDVRSYKYNSKGYEVHNKNFGKSLNTSWEGLD